LSAIEHSQTILSQLIALGQSLADAEKDFPSSLVVTGIVGGGAANVVPATCELTWLFRPADADDAHQVEQNIVAMNQQLDTQLKMRASEAGSSLCTLCDVPLFQSEGAALMSGKIGSVFNARAAIDLNFATEAGVYDNARHSVVVCGPGDMAQGHIRNEFIDVSALHDGITFINEVIDAARS